MTVSVGVYEKALARVGARLDALGLDILVRPYTSEGRILVDGIAKPASDVELDYLWLSPDISHEGIQRPAFAMVQDLAKLGVLQTFNAGLDNPAYKQISAKGTRICNSSAQAVAIAEYVMANVLAVFQPLAQQRQQQAERIWQRTPFREISHTNWLILGFGPIGQEVAKRAKAFGASTSVIRRKPATSDLVDRAGTLADLPGLLPEADVIVIACPLNAETRGLADGKFFGAMKPGATLVNIARGAIVDDAALIAALDAGRCGTAVLDVFHTEPLPGDDPLWAHPKVRITPHTSFSGDGTFRRWDELFLANIARCAKGQPLANEVAPADIG